MDRNPELLQSEYWSRVKARHGWSAHAAPYPEGASHFFLGDSVRILERPAGPFTFSYCPYGFPLSPAGEAARRDVVQGAAVSALVNLRAAATPRSLFVRWDVPWSELFWSDEAAIPGRRSDVRVQPPDTVVVDLTGDSESILGRMKAKTRYNIRLAEKRGVAVDRAEESELDAWYTLYRETAERDRITIHPFSYYQAVFSIARQMDRSEAPEIALYVARHDGDLLGSIIVSHWGGRATYLYGASSSEKRNLMGNYLLQWRAMESARRSGCTSYDLFGIPPTDDESHPMHGLYRFKTGFGGTIIHRPGCVDFDRFGLAPRLFHCAERARQWYYHTWRKRSR